MISRTIFFLLGILLAPGVMYAQESETENPFPTPAFEESVFLGEVISTGVLGERAVEGTDLTEAFQTLTVRIIKGGRSGEVVTLENSTAISFQEGDRLYLHLLPGGSPGEFVWNVGEPDRRSVLYLLAGAFALVTALVAGMAGIRSLIALAGSFGIIIFGLVPALSAGAPPVLTCTVLAVFILAFSMFVTHGFDRRTWIALIGSVLALVLAALIAEYAVTVAKLSGFVSDEAVFLNFMTDGALNLQGLLLGGILIGVVGVLNDVSVSQVHTVAELHDANPSLTRRDILRRSMRVGQEHMGAVVNTLPLAYAGVSLPLLLLFVGSDAPASFIMNREIFAAEIIRTLAGGIGLMLSGLVATLLAVVVIVREEPRAILEKQ